MDIKDQKRTLRKSLLERRMAIPDKDYGMYNDAIRERLLGLTEIGDAGVVHIYLSMHDRKEPDTFGIVKQLLGMGKRVAVPVMEKGSVGLKHVEVTSATEIRPNDWGVPEPVNGSEVGPDLCDVVIVPLAGADENRNRIGYGKGYYDNFLSGIRKPAIGLLFECCLVPQVPTEPHDIPLDKLITELRII